MKPSMLFIFKLKHCVKNVYSEPVYANREKFKYFALFTENCIIDKYNAIDFLRKIDNKKSNIKCELIVYALDLCFRRIL